MTLSRLLAASCAVMALSACAASISAPAPVVEAAAMTEMVAAPAVEPAPFPGARYQPWGLDLSAIDPSVKPGDDFWAYVNGDWAKRTEIAPDRTYVGIDSVINDDIDRNLRAIVEGLAANPGSSGKIGQQVGDFYASWMDEAAIEAAGTAPLQPHLAAIAAARTPSDFARLFGTPGYPAPVGIGFYPDLKQPDRYGIYVGQAGLGLPNRDYYLLKGEKYDAYRSAYKAHVAEMLTLAGFADVQKRADRIFDLETEIAKIHWTPEQSRDVEAIYNPMTPAEVARYAPGLDWKTALARLDLETADKLILTEKSAVKGIAGLVAKRPAQTWRDWLAFHFISDQAQFLPRAFDDADFNFYSRTLRDVQTKRDRWKRGIALLNGALGEGVGQLYVQRHYPPESSAVMGELITNFRAALQEMIETSDWMDEPTKREALAKLATFDPRTGHPEKYIDYSKLEVRRGDLLGNALRSAEFQWQLERDRWTRPVDKSLWAMNPQTNNAYYDPTTNQITFPAGILQPPYFDAKADPAANYGSIGATIGHEIGHGFDDQGRKFDSKGMLRDWWTKESADKYNVQAKRLVEQYNSYEPLPGLRIKGELTLGENLGDLGGLEMAYRAYRRYVAKHGEPPVIGGLTGDQRFFIAYGYSWQTKYREGVLRERLLADEHSPAQYRVNGAVRNMDAWYKAFNVQPGDKLYLPPEQRVRIW
jgi:putative endopeptidase